MRTTWNGSISFGLVNIPVGLAPATASSARQSDVSFRLLHRECLTPIQQKRWCPVHDVEVGPDELVRGWEASKGQFVPIEDAELEAIERHDTSRAIEITRFVKARRGRPGLLRPHLLPRPRRHRGAAPPVRAPARGDEGVRASRRSARSCSPGKEKLCLIRPKGDALALETLFVREDVKSQDEIDEAVAAPRCASPSSSSRSRSSRASRRRSTRPSSGATTARRCASCSRRSSRATSSPSRSRQPRRRRWST